ncbi:hypothetical protein CWE15_00100 [Aliidiomarina taiwanensis]|uniref:DUF962 domain-containing protein n=1 Tax=Aliidiomarina taiwanensis TaxID=946228 RepID=A0A432X8E4_9GAMM|nr:Mpo1-like protein [Aliidiomarina taiwanensis]RUO43639.1 hypothetical protein CWE15_00100 [Aliidiomarina taiwanensis]
MKSIVEQLAMYSCYHRDSRNITTHMLGIPLIVIALASLLGRPEWAVSSLVVTPALIIAVIGGIYYLLLDMMLGVLMAVFLGLCVWAGAEIAALETSTWLITGVGLFVVGWVLQFIGHAYEGRKPAFVDDIMGLAIGPLFIVAEIVFLLGLRKSLYREVEHKVRQQ